MAATNKKLKLFYIYCGEKDTLFDSNKSFHALLDQRRSSTPSSRPKGARVAELADYLVDFAPRLFR